MREDSNIICIEQTRSITKRRLFFNGFPVKITHLSDEKIFEVNIAIEIQFGLANAMYDEKVSMRLIDQIKSLERNIKIKQSKDLIDLLNDKVDEFALYCKKYNKNYKHIFNEYSRVNNYAYEAI